MTNKGFQNAFAQNSLKEMKALSEAVQRPLSVRCIQEAAPKPGWKSKPSWFLIATEDRMINPKTQQFMAERMGAKVRVRPVDHTPSLTAARRGGRLSSARRFVRRSRLSRPSIDG
jgi:hypothetical protein